MNKDTLLLLLERLVAIVLIIMLILLANPFMFWMPSMMLLAALTVIAVLFCVWAGFVLTERASDEREEAHRSLASRAGFFAGAALLTIALLIQGLAHHIDPWIPAALALMVAAKVLTRIYASRFK